MSNPAHPYRTSEEPGDNFSEAPTMKRSVPDALREPTPPAVVTTKLLQSEIDQLLHEKEKSGLRPAITEEEIALFERGGRETLPAPAQLGSDPAAHDGDG